MSNSLDFQLLIDFFNNESIKSFISSNLTFIIGKLENKLLIENIISELLSKDRDRILINSPLIERLLPILPQYYVLFYILFLFNYVD